MHLPFDQKRNPDRLETYLAQFDVAIARKEPMLAMDVCEFDPHVFTFANALTFTKLT